MDFGSSAGDWHQLALLVDLPWRTARRSPLRLSDTILFAIVRLPHRRVGVLHLVDGVQLREHSQTRKWKEGRSSSSRARVGAHVLNVSLAFPSSYMPHSKVVIEMPCSERVVAKHATAAVTRHSMRGQLVE